MKRYALIALFLSVLAMTGYGMHTQPAHAQAQYGGTFTHCFEWRVGLANGVSYPAQGKTWAPDMAFYHTGSTYYAVGGAPACTDSVGHLWVFSYNVANVQELAWVLMNYNMMQ